MADLNEETTVQEEQVEETVETKKPIDPNLQGIQLFYEKNKNMVNYVGGGLLVIIAAVCFFKFYYLPEQEAEASNEIFWAESYFEKDSFNLALKGGNMVMTPEGQKPMMGFEQIAADYSMTKTGNLANYYTGICYLRTGKFEQAIEFLKAYNGKDEMVASIALGATGDSYMELNKMDDAANYYLKAANHSNNNFTTPYYLKKAGFVYEQQGNFKEALSAYERIQKEFTTTNEGRAIDKDIAKVKALGNL
jgi:tetratricopeptide (TPR) repeat protein